MPSLPPGIATNPWSRSKDTVRSSHSKSTHADLQRIRIPKTHAVVNALVVILGHGHINPMIGYLQGPNSVLIGWAVPPNIAKDIRRIQEVGGRKCIRILGGGVWWLVPIRNSTTCPTSRAWIFLIHEQEETWAKNHRQETEFISPTRGLPIPRALAAPDGSMRKINNAVFAKVFVQDLNPPTASLAPVQIMYRKLDIWTIRGVCSVISTS